MIRKAALQAGAVVLFVLIGWTAYLSLSQMRQSQKIVELKSANANMQATISTVLRDLTDMETGQRGFLLTANDAYLQPYLDAKGRIAGDLASLRSILAERPQVEQASEARLASLVGSMQAEMERSITLRQQGYRHRAFKMIDSDEGKGYMDEARGVLSSLSSAENKRFAEVDAQSGTQRRKALLRIVGSNLGLFALAMCLVVGVRHHGRVIENAAADGREELAIRDFQLRRLTAALSTQARAKTSVIAENAGLLLENYGGFLPRQGHEYAEQIKEASAQMEQLRQELISDRDSKKEEILEVQAVA